MGRVGCGGFIDPTTYPLHVKDCRFISNGNLATTKAGGAIGLGDDSQLEDTDVRICKSVFVSNKAWKGGAIHNHEGAKTYMVNCRLTGNESTQEGGGIFNSRHTGSAEPARLFMHNCLIAGNIADGTGSADQGGGVFNGLADDIAEMEMIHCTVLGNYAGASYGGVVSVSDETGCRLKFYNSISRGNVDADVNTGAFEVNLLHVGNFVQTPTPDADNFVAAGSLPAIYNNVPTWTASDPVFVDDGSSQTWTGTASYIATTGQTSFTFSTCPSIGPGDLFRPDASDHRMLVVLSHDEGGSGCIVSCWGYWSGSGTTGTGFDLHIDSSGAADDFGDTGYVPFDWCELDGITDPPNTLPWDLDGETREVNDPDCGVYEIQS